MSARSYLVWRRAGAAWALPDDAVSAVRTVRGRATISSAAGELAADEILGFARRLAVVRPGPLIGRLLPPRCVGLAVHGGAPLAVIDPESPPLVLRAEGASDHGT